MRYGNFAGKPSGQRQITTAAVINHEDMLAAIAGIQGKQLPPRAETQVDSGSPPAVCHITVVLNLENE